MTVIPDRKCQVMCVSRHQSLIVGTGPFTEYVVRPRPVY